MWVFVLKQEDYPELAQKITNWPSAEPKKTENADAPAATGPQKTWRKDQEEMRQWLVRKYGAILEDESDKTLKQLTAHPDYRFLAGEVDGVGSKDGKRFLIECKSTSDETRFLDRDGNLDRGHDYFYQVVGYMAIHDLSKCWFIIKTETITETKNATKTETEIKKLEIPRDNDFFQSEMYPKLERFYIQHYLPRVMQKKGIEVKKPPVKEKPKARKATSKKGDDSDSDSDVAVEECFDELDLEN